MSRFKPTGPIPSQIDLGAFLLHVKMVGKREMIEESEWEDDDTEEIPQGLWCPNEETILIAKWVSKTEQRWALLHEMGHASLDFRDYYDRRNK